jgi:DNA repair protein RadC
MAHNHLSGNLYPSAADLKLTEMIHSTGRFLEFKVFDHLILGVERYRSLPDEGRM